MRESFQQIAKKKVNGYFEKIPKGVNHPMDSKSVMLAYTQGILLGLKAGMRISISIARDFKVITGEKEHKIMVKEIAAEVADHIEEALEDAERDADPRTIEPPDTPISTADRVGIPFGIAGRTPLPGETQPRNSAGFPTGRYPRLGPGDRKRVIIAIPKDKNISMLFCSNGNCKRTPEWETKTQRFFKGTEMAPRTDRKCDEHAKEFYLRYNDKTREDGVIEIKRDGERIPAPGNWK